MSLTLGISFQKGILLASDSFAFDNDSEFPQKTLDFAKFHISHEAKIVLAAVGSSWVFHKIGVWLNSINAFHGKELLERLSLKWRELNEIWKAKRKRELDDSGSSTLRPLSDSVLILARGSNLSSLYILGSEGHVTTTSTFVICGSGSYLVEHFLHSSGKSFNTSDSVQNCIQLIRECYAVARGDLYVSGYPSIVLLCSGRIVDLSNYCAQVWYECERKYFDRIESALLDP